MKKIENITNILKNIPEREPEDWPVPIFKSDLKLLLDSVKNLQDLVDKLNYINKDKEFRGVWDFYHTHGMNYTGPTWVDEMMKAEQILEKLNNEEK